MRCVLYFCVGYSEYMCSLIIAFKLNDYECHDSPHCIFSRTQNISGKCQTSLQSVHHRRLLVISFILIVNKRTTYTIFLNLKHVENFLKSIVCI